MLSQATPSLQPFLAEVVEYFGAQLVLAYGTYYPAVQAELRYVIGKVCRSSTQFLSFGQHVPQCFAHSYDDMVVIVHGVIISV